MEEQKHTPGPWQVTIANRPDIYNIGIEGPHYDGSGDTLTICDITDDGYSEETNRANAELIARAPELLERVSSLTKENERLVQWKTEAEKSLVESGKAIGALTEQVEKLKEQELCPDFLIEAYGLKTRVWTFHKTIGKYGCAECCTGDRCDEDCKAKYKGRRNECPHCKGTGWIPKADARVIPIEETLSDLSRLREERKEMVEALRDVDNFLGGEQLYREGSKTYNLAVRIKSLLSKFEP